MQFEGEKALMDRIDENDVLKLTMADIRAGATFESADHYDVRWSMRPVARARVVILEHEGDSRILKDTRPPA